MGKEIWLSMHARHFGFEKIIRTRPSVRPLLHVSQGEIFHFKYPGVNCITPGLLEIKNNNNEADSFFRPIFNLYIDVDNRERARARDKKQTKTNFVGRKT